MCLTDGIIFLFACHTTDEDHTGTAAKQTQAHQDVGGRDEPEGIPKESGINNNKSRVLRHTLE